MKKSASYASSTAIIVVRALLASYIVSAFVLLILALIMYKLDPPSGVISAGIILTYIVSTFIGGFIVGKYAKEKRFIWGIIIGVIYFLIILCVAFLLKKDVSGEIGSVISVFFTCGLGGMLGGMLS